MPLERIYMNEAGHFLAIKSSKTLEKWCARNGIKIYSESGRRFMCRIEFLAALEKPFIMTLKNKYGEKWKDIYRIMETNDSAELVAYKDINTELRVNKTNKTIRYKPKSADAKRFIKVIKNQ